MSQDLSEKEVEAMLEASEVFWQAHEDKISEKDWHQLHKVVFLASYNYLLNEDVSRNLLLRLAGYLARSIHFDPHVNWIENFHNSEYIYIMDDLGKNPMVLLWIEAEEKDFVKLAKLATYSRAVWVFRETFHALRRKSLFSNNNTKTRLNKELVDKLHLISKRASALGFSRLSMFLEDATTHKGVEHFYSNTLVHLESLLIQADAKPFSYWINLDRLVEEILIISGLPDQHPGLFACLHARTAP